MPVSALSFRRAVLKAFGMRAGNPYLEKMLGTILAGKAAGCGRKGTGLEMGTKNSDASSATGWF